MDVSDIKDRDSFQAWLEDKPKEWAQVLAARIALRIAPLAWSVAALSEDVLEKKHRENLTLLTFRANFISSVARNYPTDDMKSAAYAAAAYATNAAARAAAARAAAAYAAAAYAAAANAARTAAYAAAANAARTAAYATNAAADVWESIRTDCEWLAKHSHDEALTAAANAQALVSQPLWMNSASPDTLPEWAKAEFHQFNKSDLAQTTSFGLITDWYRSILQGKLSPFNKEAELAIAKMSPKDWGDGDDERDCIVVMDRVAKLAGWEREDFKEELYNDVQNSDTSEVSGNGFTNHKVSRALKDNREAILSLSQSLILQLSEYKKKIQFTNQFGEDYKKELLSFLQKIEDDIHAIMDAVPEIGKEVEMPKVEETVTRLNRFKARFKENLPRYFEPEHLGDISPPVSIILGCGAIGSFFGGPIGFGAGAFVGKLLTNEIKPGKVDDKVQEILDSDNLSTS